MIPFFLITPEKIVYQDTVDSVSLPTPDGEITILPHHIPLVTMLGSGVMRLKKGNDEHFLSCSNGVVKIDKNGVTVLADNAETADSLIEEDIEKAQLAAKNAMTMKKQDSVDFAQAVAILERETAKLKAVRRHKSRRNV
ncbi:MAG: ATP synthase F1 subunit epsilon [Patescibacteria group bacterium]